MAHNAKLSTDDRDRDKMTLDKLADIISSPSCSRANTQALPVINVAHQNGDYLLEKNGNITLSSKLGYPEIGELFLLLLNEEAQFLSDLEIKLDTDAITRHLDEYGTTLMAPRAEGEPVLDYFQRLSILVFKNPKLLCPEVTIDLAWAMWADEFFNYDSIAYLMYLVRALPPLQSASEIPSLKEAPASVEIPTKEPSNPPSLDPLVASTGLARRHFLSTGPTKRRWTVCDPPPMRDKIRRINSVGQTLVDPWTPCKNSNSTTRPAPRPPAPIRVNWDEAYARAHAEFIAACSSRGTTTTGLRELGRSVKIRPIPAAQLLPRNTTATLAQAPFRPRWHQHRYRRLRHKRRRALRDDRAPLGQIAAVIGPDTCAAPAPEPVTVLPASNGGPLGRRSTKTNGWLATQATSKDALVPQKVSTISPVEKLRTVTEIYPSQETRARKWVPDNSNPRPNPSKRALQRLRTTQGRKLRERLHGRRRTSSLYKTGALLADPSRAVVMYARLLVHNRSRRRSVADKDKKAEVVGFDRCINVPVMDVSTVYGHIYYAYYVAKRDEYSRVSQGIG